MQKSIEENKITYNPNNLEITQVAILKYFLPNSLLKQKLRVTVSFCIEPRVSM